MPPRRRHNRVGGCGGLGASSGGSVMACCGRLRCCWCHGPRLVTACLAWLARCCRGRAAAAAAEAGPRRLRCPPSSAPCRAMLPPATAQLPTPACAATPAAVPAAEEVPAEGHTDSRFSVKCRWYRSVVTKGGQVRPGSLWRAFCCITAGCFCCLLIRCWVPICSCAGCWSAVSAPQRCCCCADLPISGPLGADFFPLMSDV